MGLVMVYATITYHYNGILMCKTGHFDTQPWDAPSHPPPPPGVGRFAPSRWPIVDKL